MRLGLKFGILCAATAIIPLIIISALVLSSVSTHSLNVAMEQLRSDARVAASICDKRLIEMRAAAQALADDIANRALVSSDSIDRNTSTAWARLQDLLPRSQNEASLDFVTVADPLGRVIARHNDRPAPGETLLGSDKNAVAEKVITGGNQLVASFVIERGERYQRLGLDRIAQVSLSNGSTIDEALVVEAGAPIFSGGRLVGVVLIGQMLNTYYKARPGSSSLQTPLVAEARQTLYRNSEENAGVLIALGNVIIASSVPPDSRDSAGQPELAGMLRDITKNEEEFKAGSRSYNVAWQPLKSLDGSPIGAIGVARPTNEFEGPSDALWVTILLVGAVVTLAASIAGFVFGRGLGARLEELSQAANRWSLGELSTPARDRDPFLSKWIPAEFLRDEINKLAEQLEQMRESFRQAIERLRKR